MISAIHTHIMYLMMSFLQLGGATVMGHAEYKSMEICEQAIIAMKREQPNAVGACVIATRP